MAKKLIYNYEFDASAKTIKIGGNYTVRVGENGAYEYMSATEIRQGILEDAE